MRVQLHTLTDEQRALLTHRLNQTQLGIPAKDQDSPWTLFFPYRLVNREPVCKVFGSNKVKTWTPQQFMYTGNIEWAVCPIYPEGRFAAHIKADLLLVFTHPDEIQTLKADPLVWVPDHLSVFHSPITQP